MSWPYWSFLCSYMPAEVPHTCLRLLEFPTHFYAPLELPMYVYALPGIIQGWYACSSIFFSLLHLRPVVVPYLRLLPTRVPYTCPRPAATSASPAALLGADFCWFSWIVFHLGLS